jgi:hypothetical protein
MRPIVILLAIIFGTNISCKKLFDPKIDVVETPLVVDGLISDQAKPYLIRLTKALPYNNNNVNKYENEYTGISKAKVTVSDDSGNTYNFTEGDTVGVYRSNPTEFIGVPGRYYTLHIRTIDNIEYQSDPQLMLPNDFKVEVSAEYGTQDQLVEDGTGAYNKETIHGTNIFFDIENNEDTLIRFRFDHRIITQWVIPTKPPTYGWDTWPNTDLNITDNYSTSTNNIVKKNVCFVPTNNNKVIITKEWVGSPGTDKIMMDKFVEKFVIRIIQYRLNNETYLYYKNISTILSANGSIFDPIPWQVKGNVKCISDNTVGVLGYFEASSAQYSYYALNPFSKKLKYVKSYEPPTDYGILELIVPDWWVSD